MKSLATDQDQKYYMEYLKLGEQLQQMTNQAIADKFELDKMAITSIRKLDDDDLRLIRALVVEKEVMMRRRKELRNKLR